MHAGNKQTWGTPKHNPEVLTWGLTNKGTNTSEGHSLLCSLDELMTSSRFILHYTIDPFHSACDPPPPSPNNLTPHSHFHFMLTFPVRVTGLLRAVLTFLQGIFELRFIMSTDRYNLVNSVFTDESPSKVIVWGWFTPLCQVRKRWKEKPLVQKHL